MDTLSIGNGLQRGKKANQPDLRRGLRVEGEQESGTVALLAFLNPPAEDFLSRIETELGRPGL